MSAKHKIYTVTSPHGSIDYSTDGGIKEARRWARTALGVHNPKLTRLRPEQHLCWACDSAPCVCAAPAAQPGEEPSRG